MNCQQTNELIHGYMDGELDLRGTLDLERHFEACEPCATEYHKQLALRTVIKENGQYFKAPDILKKRIQNSIVSANRVQARSGLGARNWWRVAAIAVLILSPVVIWLVFVNRPSSRANELLVQDVLSSHVRSLMADHLTDVPSSDQHTVKPWFEGKVNFSPLVKDLASDGFPLVGGRLDYVANRTVAALVYQRHKHYINLFIWPASDQLKENSARQGFNVMCWSAAAMNYCAVSDVNDVDLKQFVDLIQK